MPVTWVYFERHSGLVANWWPETSTSDHAEAFGSCPYANPRTQMPVLRPSDASRPLGPLRASWVDQGIKTVLRLDIVDNSDWILTSHNFFQLAQLFLFYECAVVLVVTSVLQIEIRQKGYGEAEVFLMGETHWLRCLAISPPVIDTQWDILHPHVPCFLLSNL